MTSFTILDLKAFIPAKDFDVSRRFYTELGFNEKWHNAQVAEFEAGGFRFLLQNFYVKELAENFMMQLQVDNGDPWWERIASTRLKEKYDLHTATPPALQPWGLRVLYISDPSGVLWHIADSQR